MQGNKTKQSLVSTAGGGSGGAWQPAEGAGLGRRRGAAFRAATGGLWPLPAGGLAAAPAVGSAALLPPPWALLLRLLLQQVPARPPPPRISIPAELQRLWLCCSRQAHRSQDLTPKTITHR